MYAVAHRLAVLSLLVTVYKALDKEFIGAVLASVVFSTALQSLGPIELQTDRQIVSYFIDIQASSILYLRKSNYDTVVFLILLLRGDFVFTRSRRFSMCRILICKINVGDDTLICE